MGKLLVKPNKTNLDYYLKKGINSFLFGLYSYTSFTTCDITVKEIKNIKEKYPNIELFILLDKNLFEKDIKDLKKTLKEIEKLNISGLFFYDLAVLNIVLEEKLSIPLIWNQNFLVTNSKTCNYYKEFGVKGAVISSELEINELKEVIKNTKITTFVNIFGYQLMAFSKRKLISSYFKYINYKDDNKNKHFMIDNDNKYPIYENSSGTGILTNYILDGISYLKELKDVDYFIINELNIDEEIFKKVITIYSEALKDIDNLDKYVNKLKKIIPQSFVGFLNHKTIYKVKNV